MSIAGIAAASGYPPGCVAPPDVAGSDQALDLELMLAPLRALPEVCGLAADAGDYLAGPGRPIAATVELELDAAAPHVDFIAQLARLVERLATTRGVILPPRLTDRLARIAAHARCVSEAYLYLSLHAGAACPAAPGMSGGGGTIAEGSTRHAKPAGG